MPSLDELRRVLQRIDGRGYPAYKDLRGPYDGDGHSLHIDHVQGDPFAAPSKLRVRVSMERAALPEAWHSTPVRRLALEDFLARRMQRGIETSAGGRRGSGKSGLIRIDAGAQEVLERTAAVFTPDWVELRLEAGLPAAGRRVLGREAEALLCDEIPRLALAALCADALPHDDAWHFVTCVENQEHIRGQLADLGLVAFVADGALLPRESGASDRPMRSGGLPLHSPASLRAEVALAHEIETREGGRTKTLAGLGVPRGITLIVGGGYHGKTTLLRALERGVYPHVPDDGREGVVSDPGLVKVRAEDGRRVVGVDIRPFIGTLPGDRRTDVFSSDDASGSTSQAASIIEAVEAGATGLLLDEDTSATNFMLRDARMQALVQAEHEPITPFVDRVRELYTKLGVSTVLVMGGCGDYFDVADTVIRMRDYAPENATEEARQIARTLSTARRSEVGAPLTAPPARIPLRDGFDPRRGRREVVIDVRDRDEIRYGRESLDLRGVEQLVDPSQTRAVGHGIHLATQRWLDGECSLARCLDLLDALLDEEGLDVLDPFGAGEPTGRHPGRYARPRRYEIAAAINRLRSTRIRQEGGNR